MLQEISDNYRIFTINNGLSIVKVLLEITIENLYGGVTFQHIFKH